MPYIRPEERKLLDCGSKPQTVGHLTYLYTKAILEGGDSTDALLTLTTADWLVTNGVRFQTFAQILGALTATELEWCRRKPTESWFPIQPISRFRLEFYDTIVGPYEDGKIKENGDVY